MTSWRNVARYTIDPVSGFEFANGLSLQTVRVFERFEFLIRSVNNLKTARHKIVNQSDNGYG